MTAALDVGGVHTLVTHDTPRVKGFWPAGEIGNPLLDEYIQFYQPRVHAFGHCHLSPAIIESGPTILINADRRVILRERRKAPDA
jgi:Icc-related predicted phosphoesterase